MSIIRTLHKPVYADIPIKTLLDYDGNLFMGLYNGFPRHTSIEACLENLFTWDQINAVFDSGVTKGFSYELQTAIKDYLKEDNEQ